MQEEESGAAGVSAGEQPGNTMELPSPVFDEFRDQGWRPQSRDYKQLSDAMVHLRGNLRTLLSNYGVPSNPGWSEDDIIGAFSGKLSELYRDLRKFMRRCEDQAKHIGCEHKHGWLEDEAIDAKAMEAIVAGMKEELARAVRDRDDMGRRLHQMIQTQQDPLAGVNTVLTHDYEARLEKQRIVIGNLQREVDNWRSQALRARQANEQAMAASLQAAKACWGQTNMPVMGEEQTSIHSRPVPAEAEPAQPGGRCPLAAKIDTSHEAELAFRERIYAWVHNLEKAIEETRIARASVDHVQRLEATMRTFRIELTAMKRDPVTLTVDEIARGEMAVLKDRMDGLVQTTTEDVARLDELSRLLDGAKADRITIREDIASVKQGLHDLTAISSHSEWVQAIERKVEALELRLDAVAHDQEILIASVTQINRDLTSPKLDNRLGSIETRLGEVDRKFNYHLEHIKMSDDRLAGLGKDWMIHDGTIRELVEGMKALRQWQANTDHAVKNLAEMMVSTIEMRHRHEPQIQEQVEEMRHTHEGCASPVEDGPQWRKESDELRADVKSLVDRVGSIEGQLVRR